MLRSRSTSGAFIVAYTSITLYQQVDGFPVVDEKAIMIPRVDNPPPPLPFLPRNSNARWLNSSENAATSALVARFSASDAVHDKMFIPAIASMGVLVIICAFCCYQLIINKGTVHSIGAIPNSQGRYNEPVHSQHAVGRQENGDGALSRGLSKVTRKSAPSLLASLRGSLSVHSDAVGYHHHLQQQRLQQQRQQLEQQQQQQQQQQDPYQQYMMAHDHNHSGWQHTPHPSAAGSTMQRGGGVQPQPHSVQAQATRTIGPNPTGDPSVVQTGQPPPFTNAAHQRPGMHQTPVNANPAARAGWDPYQKLQQQPQQQRPDLRTSHTPSAQTSSTQVTSEALSYMTPPEARRPPLHSNQSQPANQDYFSTRPAGSNNLPSQPGGSGNSITHGMIAHSVPANYNTASRGPSSPNSAHTPPDIHVQPPSYSETKSDVQGKTTTTFRPEKKSSSSNKNV